MSRFSSLLVRTGGNGRGPGQAGLGRGERGETPISSLGWRAGTSRSWAGVPPCSESGGHLLGGGQSGQWQDCPWVEHFRARGEDAGDAGCSGLKHAGRKPPPCEIRAGGRWW